jgi:anaerobic selenocysteine-containing dehydrogenase
VRGLPEFGGELPVAALADEIETPGKGQVRGMLTLAGNPVSSTPDGGRLDRAMEGLEFMAAIDIYINETTRHADVILPPTTILERDHYDLAFHALAIRNTARYTPAVFDKDPGTRHDWEIMREVGLRLLKRIEKKRPLKQRLMIEARLRLRPRFTIDLLLRTGRSRLSVAKLLSSPAGIDLGPLRSSLPGRLRTRDKHVALAPAELLSDLSRLLAVTPMTEGELLLIGRRHKNDCNSWMHNSERLTKGRARHQLFMHPHDLAARELSDGSLVLVTSNVGKVEVEVAATDDVMPGVVSLPHGFGQNREGVLLSRAQTLPGVSINDLTDTEGTDVSGNSRLSGVPVQVSPAG